MDNSIANCKKNYITNENNDGQNSFSKVTKSYEKQNNDKMATSWKNRFNIKRRRKGSEIVAVLTAPEKEGWLVKRGLNVKSWKKRWFVLKENTLLYFKNQNYKELEPSGLIYLQSCSVVVLGDKVDKSFAIEIFTPTRSYVIHASNEQEMNEWIAVISARNTIKSPKAGETQEDTLSSTGADDPFTNPNKQGFLVKQGLNVKNLKKRWFVLKGANLYYCKEKDKNTPQGAIFLKDAAILQNIELSSKFGFEVLTPTRTYLLFAENQTEANEWIVAIKHAIPPEQF